MMKTVSTAWRNEYIIDLDIMERIMHMNREPFGKSLNGEEVSLYTLKNGTLTARVTDFGATLVSLSVKDNNGEEKDT